MKLEGATAGESRKVSLKAELEEAIPGASQGSSTKRSWKATPRKSRKLVRRQGPKISGAGASRKLGRKAEPEGQYPELLEVGRWHRR